MQSVIVDAALLGIPNYAIDAIEAEELINRVIHLAEIAHPSVPIDAVICVEDEDEIWINNLGPEYSNISDFIDVVGLSGVFSPNDISTAYQSIFQFCSRSVAKVPNSQVDSNLIAPGLPEGLGPTALVGLSRRCIFEVAARRNEGGNDIVFGSFVAHDPKRFAVDLISDDDGSSYQANVIVPVIYQYSDLVHGQFAGSIWDKMTCASDVLLAILLLAQELKIAAGTNEMIDAGCWALGREFYHSLAQNEAHGGGRYGGATLTLCAQIVAGLCNRPIKPFGKDGQKTRGQGDLAFRVHVTKAGTALRLMIWNDGKRVEFANVGPKFEVDIRDERPAVSFAGDWTNLMQ